MPKIYENTLCDYLLHDNMFNLTSKTIKKIYVKSDQIIEIKKGSGLSMTVESHNSIVCKIDGDILQIEPYVEPFTFYNLCSCIGSIKSYTPVNTETNYSEVWNINSVFIIKQIECSGAGTLIISEGFDKSLKCNRLGKGLTIIKNLNVVNLDCKITGNGKIKIIDSYCSNFNGEIVGNGQIVTPMVNSKFSIRTQGKAYIKGTKSSKCTINKNISKDTKIEIIDGDHLFEL